MKQANHSESGQTLVEYALLVALVAMIPLTFIPAAIAYQYMRRVRHTDRKTAFLVGIGFTMLLGMVSASVQQGAKLGVVAADRAARAGGGWGDCTGDLSAAGFNETFDDDSEPDYAIDELPFLKGYGPDGRLRGRSRS